MKKLTKKELNSIQTIKNPEVWDYVEKLNFPGFECKVQTGYNAIIFNKDTNEAVEFRYHETTCYGNSSTDIQYNGHYNECDRYQAE